jgi:choline dehydrogenase-like flavoprotein
MSEIYDAIVVGSGATGGWAAKELTEKGLKVLLLEAGRKLNPLVDFKEHTWPYELEYRGFGNMREMELRQPIQSKIYACSEYGNHLFVSDVDNPYTTPPGKPFYWIRARQVGGRTIPWGRMTFRFSNYDFKAASHDGYGDDWPISYEDIAPYYDKVEEFIGVSGTAENLPQLPDGKFLPSPAFTCGEHLIKKTVARMNNPEMKVIMSRTTVLTKTIHKGTPNERPACHWCGHCDRGCSTGSYFSSPVSTLPAAERTGRFTLVTNAIVSHITVDKSTGKATGVYYVDSITRQHREVKARVVVLCASTLESTRILLNSASSLHPNGLGNSSGVLGHYLMDHVKRGGASGTLPINIKEMQQDGRANGIYIPRFQNLKKKHGKFIRGYGLQGGAGQTLWDHARRTAGFGADFKKKIRSEHPWRISLSGFGEALARYENHVTLNKDVVDAWGIPVLHIDMAFGDNEAAIMRDMGDSAEEILKAAGASNISVTRGPTSVPGLSNHEMGTARMGNDPKKSVLNKFNQVHDVKNVFVTDGACFVSIGNQNPTLTMMALTARACEYLVNELKSGRL